MLSRLRAWDDYCDAEAPLEPAIRKLVGDARKPATKRARRESKQVPPALALPRSRGGKGVGRSRIHSRP
jgi:hypothetical protein